MVVSDGIFWNIPALICGPLNVLYLPPVPLSVLKQCPKLWVEGSETLQADNFYRNYFDVN